MSTQLQSTRHAVLLLLLATYAAASLFHYVHNAVYLEEYPNMPAWLSPAEVYAAWCAVTAVGIVGYITIRHGFPILGLILIAVYGVLGLDGLQHYRLAPLSAHTFMMNLTIWLEAFAASAVLIGVAGFMAKQIRDNWTHV